MEKLFKVKYWDYSEHRFQFQGRICLQSSLCWGFLGLILARVIHPPVEWIVAGLPFVLLIVVDILFTAAFAGDVAVSVRTALDLAKLLEELDELRAQGAQLRQELSESALVRLTNLSYRVDEARGEWRSGGRRPRKAGRYARERGRRLRPADRDRQGALTNLSYRVDEARGEFAEKADDVKEQILARLDELRRRFSARGQPRPHAQKHAARQPDRALAAYDDVLQR